MNFRKTGTPLTSIREFIDPDAMVISSYDVAIQIKDCYLLIYGDEGGQIYITIPLRMVKAEQSNLAEITKKIDSYGWADPRSCGYVFEVSKPNKDIAGGMGGARFEKDLWIHEELKAKEEEIRALLGMEPSYDEK